MEELFDMDDNTSFDFLINREPTQAEIEARIKQEQEYQKDTAHIVSFEHIDISYNTGFTEIPYFLKCLQQPLLDKLSSVENHKGCWFFIFSYEKPQPTFKELKHLIQMFNKYLSYDGINIIHTQEFIYEDVAGVYCNEDQFFAEVAEFYKAEIRKDKIANFLA